MIHSKSIRTFKKSDAFKQYKVPWAITTLTSDSHTHELPRHPRLKQKKDKLHSKTLAKRKEHNPYIEKEMVTNMKLEVF